MKKLIIISLLILSYVISFGQNSKTLSAVDPSGSWYYENDLGASGDTLGAGDSIWYFTVIPNKGDRIFYKFVINLDSVGGTGGVNGLVPVVLKGREIESDTYVAIDTLTWIAAASTSNDTTIIFEQQTTASFYTDYQLYIKMKNDSFRSRVDWIKARFWK